MEQNNQAQYGHLVEYGKQVVSHLNAIRGRQVQPLKREGALGKFDAQFVTDALRTAEKQRVTYIFHRAPSSRKSLDYLRKVYISELRWSEVHRGSVAVVRTLTMARDLKVVGDDGLLVLVEDELGAVHRLRVYNLPSAPSQSQGGKTSNLDDILPPGAVLAIKEPYCEAASDDMSGIRVDHPSDLCYLSEGHSLFPSIWKHQFDDPSISPSESLKNEGNAFFKSHKYCLSAMKYTDALRFGHPPSLGATLLLNRAQAYILLGNYTLAVSDVQKYLSEIATNPEHAKSQDEKALFRGAKASYAMRKFQEAHDSLEKLVKDFPQNKEALQELTRAKSRLEEEKWARYDWPTLSAEARKPIANADVADYVGSIKMNASGAWVASHDIKAGELLLVSKALDVLFAAEVENEEEKALVYDATRVLLGESEGWKLTRKIASKISQAPSLVEDVEQLATSLEVYRENELKGSSSKKATVVDDRAVIDMNVVDSVREAFATPFPAIHPLVSGGSSVLSGVGLWTASARPHLPHACLPNTSRSFLGDVLILRACRDIRSGEALTVSHVHPALPLEERQAELTRPGTKLEACRCQFCVIEEKEGSEMRARRVELVQRVKTLSDRAPAEKLRTDAGRDESAGPSNDAVKDIAREVSSICDAIEATFSHPASSQPRFPVLEPLSYLFACYLYLGPSHTEDAMRANARYFAALGFEFEYVSTGRDADAGSGGDVLVKRHGYYHPLVVQTLVQQSSVCWQLGKKRTADEWRRIAENAMEIVAGHRRLFKEGFGRVYSSLNWEL